MSQQATVAEQEPGDGTPGQNTSAERPMVRAVVRAISVIETLAAEGRHLTLAELTKELHIPKSTLSGILRTLQAAGWLDEKDGRFGLGMQLLLAGSSYIDFDPMIVHTDAVLDQLVGSLEETVHLGRLDGSDVVYLAKRESPHALRLFSAIGRRLPAHATALGKAILASMEPDEVRETLGASLVKLTEYTITDYSALFDELALTRERGWALDNQENTVGVQCLAVAVSSGAPRPDALSYSIPMLRLDQAVQQRAVDLLFQAKRTLSRDLY